MKKLAIKTINKHSSQLDFFTKNFKNAKALRKKVDGMKTIADKHIRKGRDKDKVMDVYNTLKAKREKAIRDEYATGVAKVVTPVALGVGGAGTYSAFQEKDIKHK